MRYAWSSYLLKIENQSILICKIHFTGFNGKQHRNEVRWHIKSKANFEFMMSSCKNKFWKSNVSLLISNQLSWFILYLSFVISSAPISSFLLVFCVRNWQTHSECVFKKNWPSFHLCTPNFFSLFFLYLIFCLTWSTTMP